MLGKKHKSSFLKLFPQRLHTLLVSVNPRCDAAFELLCWDSLDTLPDNHWQVFDVIKTWSFQYVLDGREKPSHMAPVLESMRVAYSINSYLS